MTRFGLRAVWFGSALMLVILASRSARQAQCTFERLFEGGHAASVWVVAGAETMTTASVGAARP